MRKLLLFIFLLLLKCSFAQDLGKLTVEKIMRDPKWIGTSPKNATWSADGKYLLFSWNPEKAISDSVYYITTSDLKPTKTSAAFRHMEPSIGEVVFNAARTAYAYVTDGDLYYTDLKSGKIVQVTKTVDTESFPQFTGNGKKIAFVRNQNLYAWDNSSGSTEQLTNFKTGIAPKEIPLTAQEKWLLQNQLETSEVLQERKHKRDLAEGATKAEKLKEPRAIYLDEKNLGNMIVISPDARFITYTLSKGSRGKSTVVPEYVSESGFTSEINGRTKVGAPQQASELYVYDILKDTIQQVKTDKLPGLDILPGFLKDYKIDSTSKKKREVKFSVPFWNKTGSNAFIEIRSLDNKDRWLMQLNAATTSLKLLDHQRDEAWIGGPGIGYGLYRNVDYWIDENTFWYQTEASGYSHLYKMNVVTGEKTALTSGNFEVQDVQLSGDGKIFYITTNEVHPGEKQYYRLPVNGGKAEKLTTMTGGNEVTLSPDEKQLAILYSYSNRPPELYLQENKSGAKAKQLTFLAQSVEFKSYPWREPEIITIKARDGQPVYARLFRPTGVSNTKPAVLFVHGAGYLQDAHKWWSDSYFREYMFNNLLADNGYTVLEIDYRGSAGYGRNWRTGIYRHMGGEDLDDNVDAAKYLVQNLGVDPKRIGMYGGSYGGFMTLMAMFTEPDVFSAGAALRSVTDWAHYNHGYTSNILNQPYEDSIAYKKSSPIYYAEGLKGHLLMCHGMVDQNVHFQDIVRLAQRLVELGKNNWELAVYPVEDHGFVEPSSWTDEYKRVFKLFEQSLK
jgi:dipeptidyl aminopeptidase/acylaminoacyl peptidase